MYYVRSFFQDLRPGWNFFLPFHKIYLFMMSTQIKIQIKYFANQTKKSILNSLK